MTPKIWSVAELNRLARSTLESAIPLLWVGGEVSNLVVAASGHVYFTLKDAQAAVRCVMFRSRAQTIGWRLANGDKVEANARVTLYEARGDFQLGIESLRRAGSGNLFEAFLRLKEKLEREGLFDPAAKRALPAFPRAVGILTSPQAAALRDVVTTFRRRSPQVRLILYPTPVQGADAPPKIVAAIAAANRRASEDGCELLIVCRGGGSLEDLWAFNDEAVARAIRASALPVISGVGHETDFTIADFAADLRAPTPTAAAEQAAPERDRLLQRLDDLGWTLQTRMHRRIELARHRLELLAGGLTHPAERLHRLSGQLAMAARRMSHGSHRTVADRRTAVFKLAERLSRVRPDCRSARYRIESATERLSRAARAHLAAQHARLAALAARLQAIDPHAVLDRGYALVSLPDGRLLKNAADAELGAAIGVRLAHGQLQATVTARSEPDNSGLPFPTR
jgi:exodeoxyribonuclease VII large subunit